MADICISCEKTKDDLEGLMHVTFPKTGYLLCYWCCEMLAGKKYFNLLQESDSFSSSTKKRIGNKLRFTVYERDGYKCQYCGSQSKLTLDHIMPEASGGKTVEENLVTACRDCNIKKGTKTPEEANMSLLGGG